MGFAQTEILDNHSTEELDMNMQLPLMGRSLILQRPTLSAQSTASNVSIEKSLRSDDLLQGHKAVGIEHNGALYRLQATKLGKLILTK